MSTLARVLCQGELVVDGDGDDEAMIRGGVIVGTRVGLADTERWRGDEEEERESCFR